MRYAMLIFVILSAVAEHASARDIYDHYLKELVVVDLSPDQKNRVRQSVKPFLVDPEARFDPDYIALRWPRFGGIISVCGKVDAKNASGDYAGMQPFCGVFSPVDAPFIVRFTFFIDHARHPNYSPNSICDTKEEVPLDKIKVGSVIFFIADDITNKIGLFKKEPRKEELWLRENKIKNLKTNFFSLVVSELKEGDGGDAFMSTVMYDSWYNDQSGLRCWFSKHAASEAE